MPPTSSPLGHRQYELLHWLDSRQPGAADLTGVSLADAFGLEGWDSLTRLERRGLVVARRRRGKIVRVELTRDGREAVAAGPELLSVPTRIGLFLAARGPTTVNGLCSWLGLRKPTVERSVRSMDRRGLVRLEPEGIFVGLHPQLIRQVFWTGNAADLPDVDNPYRDEPEPDRVGSFHMRERAQTW